MKEGIKRGLEAKGGFSRLTGGAERNLRRMGQAIGCRGL